MEAMTHATSRPPKTIDDYLALPEEVRAELIGGEIYVTPQPTPNHSWIVLRLGTRLEAWIEAHGWGRAFVAPVGVHLDSGDVVEPDLVLVSKAREHLVQEKWIEGAPDLLIEVVSPSHPERDRIVKFDLYARNGVPEYWLVSLVPGTIEVFRLEGGAYRPAGFFPRGSALVSVALPGLRLPVDDVFS